MGEMNGVNEAVLFIVLIICDLFKQKVDTFGCYWTFVEYNIYFIITWLQMPAIHVISSLIALFLCLDDMSS